MGRCSIHGTYQATGDGTMCPDCEGVLASQRRPPSSTHPTRTPDMAMHWFEGWWGGLKVFGSAKRSRGVGGVPQR